MSKAIRIVDEIIDKVLTVLLILVLLTGVYFVCDTWYVYYHASAGRVTMHKPAAEAGEEDGGWGVLGEDYVAWITLDDTPIDYPIMQGETNSTYLNTDPYGNYSLSGSIFLDSRNAPDFSDSYCLVYGHHMSGDLMFGALDRYYDEKYFDEHRQGTLSVGGSDYAVEVFAIVSTDARNKTFFEMSERDAILAEAKNDALIYREPEKDNILALSTCVDASSTTRTVVLCTVQTP